MGYQERRKSRNEGGYGFENDQEIGEKIFFIRF